MRNRLSSLVQCTAAVAALGTFAFGCAGDVGTVDRVQPGYVVKEDLLGKSWYYRRTVVDSSENTSFVTVGTGDWRIMERIRWQVQEDFLFAYRDYPYIKGTEAEGYEGSEGFMGEPIAAFPIESHFDIQYEYNPQTGEPTNVRSENTQDRPWHEREYMRVDWSTNHATPQLDYLLPVDYYEADGGVSGGSFYVYEDEAANPNRARIEPENGYMDFVVNHFLVPDQYFCAVDLGMRFPNCGPSEVLVRHAFLKVDEDQQQAYRTLSYPDTVPVKDADGNEIRDPATNEVLREPIFERFGYYRVERPEYDRQRGLTESGVDRRIIRFHIWERSVDENGEVIPYAERTPKPIVYHLNWDFPDDLKEAATEVAAEWNEVFRTVVAERQNRALEDVRDMFVLRENSCNMDNLNSYLDSHPDVDARVRDAVSGELSKANMDHWCAAAEYYSYGLEDRFSWQQVGDPRFNMMHYVTEISQAPWLGLGPMFGDPVTGENISATSFVLGWGVERQATRALEYIDFINGELTAEELMTGINRPYEQSLASYDSDARNRLLFGKNEYLEMTQKRPSDDFIESISERLDRFRGDAQAGPGGGPMVPLENADHFGDRMARVAGTAFEREWLLQPHDYVMASGGTWEPGMPVDQELQIRASMVNQHIFENARGKEVNRYFHERTLFPAAQLDSALVGLAEELKDLGKCPEEGEPGYDPNCVDKGPEERRQMRRQRLKEEVFKAVMLHEVGHNVGLRHNFEGTWDAVNFPDTFWELETTAGLSEEGKLEARQPEYKYSSIMDYHGRVNGDFHGLGKYDAAAIAFGYGQLVEIFADTSVQGGDALREFRFANDYRDLLTGDDPYFDSLEQLSSRDYVELDWTQPELSRDQLRAITESEVPYKFCSDEFVNMIPTCRSFDMGANPLEQMAAATARYKNYWVFDRFLRNRVVLDQNRALTPAQMAFDTASQIYKYWYLYNSQDPDFYETERGQEMISAFAQGFNLMTEVLAMPEPGEYVRCGQGESAVYYPSDITRQTSQTGQTTYRGLNGESCESQPSLMLPMGDAQPFFLGFTSDEIAWTFSYLGSYFDKDLALFFLTNPTATYFRVNDIEDLRTYSVSPYRIFDKEILDLMDNWVRYDRPDLGSFVDATELDSNGQPENGVSPRRLVDLNQSLDGDVINDDDGEQPNGTPVFPALSRYLQRRGTLLGQALLTSPLDSMLDFGRHARVALKGSNTDFDHSEQETNECTIPESGLTYVGFKVNGEESIGYKLIEDCKNAVDNLDDNRNRLSSLQQQLDYLRALHEVYQNGAEL
mgnify:CR=1 FL=1